MDMVILGRTLPVKQPSFGFSLGTQGGICQYHPSLAVHAGNQDTHFSGQSRLIALL